MKSLNRFPNETFENLILGSDSFDRSKDFRPNLKDKKKESIKDCI